MSWSEFHPAKGQHKAEYHDQITIGRSGRRITIRVGNTVCERLGWKPGMRIRIMRGNEQDDGKLRLVAGEEGYTLRRPSTIHSYLQLEFRPWPGAAGEKHLPVRVARLLLLTIQPAVLELGLPTFLGGKVRFEDIKLAPPERAGTRRRAGS